MFGRFFQSMSKKLFKTAVHGTSRRKPVTRRLEVEGLESRQLMAAGLSASLSQGILTIEATPQADKIILRQANNRMSIVGLPGSFAAEKIKSVVVEGFENGDTVTLTNGRGLQKVAAPIFVHWSNGMLQRRTPAGGWKTLVKPAIVDPTPVKPSDPAPVDPAPVDPAPVDPIDPPPIGPFPPQKANSAPVLTALPDQTVKSGRSVTINLAATDADGDPLTYSASLAGAAPGAAVVEVHGNQLTITATAGIEGDGTVQVTVSDGKATATKTFKLRVLNNLPPALAAIADQTMKSGTTLTVPISAIDPEGQPVNYRVIDTVESRAYQLMKNFSLKAGAVWENFENWLRAGEKWILNSIGNWYVVLPNGDLYGVKKNVPIRTVAESCYFIDTLTPAYHADTSLLTNALAPPATVTVSGNQLTVTSVAGYVGSFTVEVIANDGQASTLQTVRVIVTADGQLDPTAKISPKDGSVWVLKDSTLRRNDQIVLGGEIGFSSVQQFEMTLQGEVYALTHALDPWHWTSELHWSNGTTWTQLGWNAHNLSLDTLGRAYVQAGSMFLRFSGVSQEVLASEVSYFQKYGEEFFVQQRDGKLSLFQGNSLIRVATNVNRFNLAEGKLAITTSDGNTETTMLTGDLAGFMRAAIENEPQPPTTTNPSGNSHGVIGHINVAGPIMAEYGSAQAPKSVLSSVGRIDVARAGRRLEGGSGTLLYWGDNQYVLTAAHVVEDDSGNPYTPDDFTKITFNLAFAHQNNLVSVNLAGVEVDGVIGRDHFEGRDLALLHLKRPVREVFGAHLPENDIPLKKVLLAGYGKDSANDQTKNLTFGYGTIDREHEVISRNYASGRPFMRGEHVVNVYHAGDGEAAVASGDSGGPAFLAQTRVFDGDTYLAPTIVGVHSAIQDANGDGVPADGEETYSVQITAAVARLIKSYIPYRHVKVAEYRLHVIENGDGDFDGDGEWEGVQFGVNGRVWTNPHAELSVGDNSYFVFPSPAGDPAWRDDLSTTNVKTLDLYFYAKDENDPTSADDDIGSWSRKGLEVAWFKGKYGAWHNVSGTVKPPDNDDTRYAIEVMVGWYWVPTP